MKVKVYAKLNLTLNVLGRRDGYHVIDSVVTSADVFDTVEVSARADSGVFVTGCGNIPFADNTAYKTACGFIERFSTSGVDVKIEKGIPMGAGMGGSSADAAAVAYCMCKLFGVDVLSKEVKQLCAEVGSDVNYMLRGGLARITGKGDGVQPVKNSAELYFAVTTFQHKNSTAQVYAEFDRLPQQEFVDNNALLKVITAGYTADLPLINHLRLASENLSSYADGYLAYAESIGRKPAMTGSGSAYFIMCDTFSDAERLAGELNSKGFATFACRSVDNGIVEI